MITAQQIIAAINPDLYYNYGKDKKKLKEFKELIKEKGPYNAIKEMQKRGKTITPQAIRIGEGGSIDSENGIEATHTLTYDSSSQTLEPIYFFLLDLMGNMGLQKIEKLSDNFTSSPGSGHFAELGQRATIMQQQGMKILGDVNTVLRSILNIIYDLKEFKTRIQSYKDLESPGKKEAATLSLKQIWMDKVDALKGNSSIKAMALTQAGFQTLIDAFLVIQDESLKDKTGKEIDLNERIKRILKPRIQEFNTWLKESEKELTKRYEIEKTYLKSQVNSIKLYAKWAKPYLRAAHELESQASGRNPALVKTFNTILLELSLFGQESIDPKSAAIAGNLPKNFADQKTLKTLKNKYFGCVLIEFNFRGIPQKATQQAHYTFGGKADVTFKGYALNQEEINKLKKELDKSDWADSLSLIEGATDESLKQLEGDITEFLGEETKEEPKKTGSNPFLALFGYYNKKPKEEPKKKQEKPKPEKWIEKNYLRPLAAEMAKNKTFDLFDTYKGAHGMPKYT